jgi:hypothetical protein
MRRMEIESSERRTCMTINACDLLGSARTDCGEIDRHPFELNAVQAIELRSGERIKISEMHQFHTYGGMLCGFPSRVHADWHMEQALGRAKRQFPNIDIERAVIFPPEVFSGTTVKKVYPEMARRLGLSSDIEEQRIEWEMLPKITTVAQLQMTTSLDSVLAIWWQREIGYPDSKVLAQISNLSWIDHVVENDP